MKSTGGRNAYKVLVVFFVERNNYQTITIYNMNWVRSKKLFRELFGDSIITPVDVGAKAESAEELTPLENHFIYIDFDTDDDEVKKLNSFPSMTTKDICYAINLNS